MTIPMMLTISRLVFAAPLMYVLLLFEEPTWTWVLMTLVVFAALCLTDLFDGRLARGRGQTSAWGKVLDPIADKVFVIGTIFVLLYLHDLSPIFFILLCVIAFREILISGIREGFAGKFEFPVTRLAKWKTASQMVALSALIVGDAFGEMLHPYLFSFFIPAIFLGTACFLTVRTGLDYLDTAVRRSLEQSQDNRVRF